MLRLVQMRSRSVAAAAQRPIAHIQRATAAAACCPCVAAASSVSSPVIPLPLSSPILLSRRGLTTSSSLLALNGKRRSGVQTRKVVEVQLPAYTSAAELAVLLKTTLRRLAKQAARAFPEWWPSLTARGMRKDGFTEVKEAIFSYDDAALLAAHCRRAPQPRDLEAEEVAWAATRPFGPARVLSRPPVVAILGHKDHGKTTLLDRLRGGNVAAKEEFGITQETYAFNVQIRDPSVPESAAPKKGAPASPAEGVHSFSFLDTPGHVSFTEMRSNVAAISDLIMLVVAADEGVLDQTFETLRTARQLERPLVVVINKCDLPGAAEKVAAIKAELIGLGAKIHPPSKPLVSLTGDLVVLETSALHDQTGFAELRSTLLQVVKQLKPTTDSNAVPRGRVLEAMVSQGRGNVLRVALTQGTLRVGQPFVAEGVFEGRVKEIRAMRGAAEGEMNLSSVGAGVTVDIAGCIALANPGAEFRVHSNWDQAKLIAATRRNEIRYQDQQRVVDRRMNEPQEEELEEEFTVDTRRRGNQRQERDIDQDDEEEFDEVEEVDELGEESTAEFSAEDGEEFEAEEEGEELIPAEEVPIDLDPRGRVAPALPPRSTWELSPPPPPTQRALPIAQLRPKFKFYSLANETPDASAGDATGRNAAVRVESPAADKKFGLNILLKTANMGALSMLRHAIEELNARSLARGLPEIHVAYAAAGDLNKKDLVNAEAEGCWVYGFRIARPSKPAIQQARSRRVPLFAFRHHQHLLDHLERNIELSPVLTETGEAKLEEDQHQGPVRRSHPSVQ